MSNVKIRTYSDFQLQLDKLAEGVKTHSAEEGFPTSIKETDIRQNHADLEALRIAYEAAENVARMKYDEYVEKYRNVQEMASNNNTMLYGFYGKKNQVVADFGLVPHKSRPRVKANVKLTTEPASN